MLFCQSIAQTEIANLITVTIQQAKSLLILFEHLGFISHSASSVSQSLHSLKVLTLASDQLKVLKVDWK